MNYDDEWPDHDAEVRREVIARTIRPTSVDELRLLGEQRFTIVTDPWFIRWSEFLNTHSSVRFYRAESPEGAEVIFCKDTDQGVWFLPGKGMGILQPKGIKLLREIVEAL